MYFHLQGEHNNRGKSCKSKRLDDYTLFNDIGEIHLPRKQSIFRTLSTKISIWIRRSVNWKMWEFERSFVTVSLNARQVLCANERIFLCNEFFAEVSFIRESCLFHYHHRYSNFKSKPVSTFSSAFRRF